MAPMATFSSQRLVFGGRAPALVMAFRSLILEVPLCFSFSNFRKQLKRKLNRHLPAPKLAWLKQKKQPQHMGVSENRLNPIVPNGFADHYPYEKWLAIIGKINPTFSGPNPLNPIKPPFSIPLNHHFPMVFPMVSPAIQGNPYSESQIAMN